MLLFPSPFQPKQVDTAEFLRAFKKNNQQPDSEKTRAMEEYLELYINSRLKIRQAYDQGLDTLPQIKGEVENLRNQIIEGYMSDPEAVTRLTNEAFERSQKDIHAAYIQIRILVMPEHRRSSKSTSNIYHMFCSV